MAFTVLIKILPFEAILIILGSTAPVPAVNAGCVIVKIEASAAEAFEFSSSNEKLQEPLLMPVKLIFEAVV